MPGQGRDNCQLAKCFLQFSTVGSFGLSVASSHLGLRSVEPSVIVIANNNIEFKTYNCRSSYASYDSIYAAILQFIEKKTTKPNGIRNCDFWSCLWCCVHLNWLKWRRILNRLTIHDITFTRYCLVPFGLYNLAALCTSFIFMFMTWFAEECSQNQYYTMHMYRTYLVTLVGFCTQVCKKCFCRYENRSLSGITPSKWSPAWR